MTQSPIPVPPPAPRPAGPGLVLSLVVGAIGLVIAIASAIAVTVPLLGTFTSTVYSVPGDLNVHLRDARYTVFQRTGTSSGFGGIDRDPSVFRIPPSEVSVVAPDGSIVPVTFEQDSERITRGSTVYSASLVFDAPVNGDYEIRFTNAVTTRVIIVRSISDAVESVAVWIGTGALGGVVLVLGIVLLVVGATRRGRQKRAAYAGWGGPPGSSWYGPPSAQWGTPGVTSPYPPQYPPTAYPPQYPPPGGYPPPPPAGYPPPPPAEPPDGE